MSSHGNLCLPCNPVTKETSNNINTACCMGYDILFAITDGPTGLKTVPWATSKSPASFEGHLGRGVSMPCHQAQNLCTAPVRDGHTE
mmetsp:Transcript_89417/g.154867  ORF Transcript_89417/g.154867 Transcript_89417/m.154867 type:complete len:87 (+) Transcript_89417:257-517(+)